MGLFQRVWVTVEEVGEASPYLSPRIPEIGIGRARFMADTFEHILDERVHVGLDTCHSCARFKARRPLGGELVESRGRHVTSAMGRSIALCLAIRMICRQ